MKITPTALLTWSFDQQPATKSQLDIIVSAINNQDPCVLPYINGNIPTSDASGKNDDFFFNVSTGYFKIQGKWYKFKDVSTVVGF